MLSFTLQTNTQYTHQLCHEKGELLQIQHLTPISQLIN